MVILKLFPIILLVISYRFSKKIGRNFFIFINDISYAYLQQFHAQRLSQSNISKFMVNALVVFSSNAQGRRFLTVKTQEHRHHPRQTNHSLFRHRLRRIKVPPHQLDHSLNAAAMIEIGKHPSYHHPPQTLEQ